MRVSPKTYERVTTVVTVAVFLIIVTGAAVRLTESGLGCPDWPTCENGRLVAESDFHGQVESANRLVTGAVSVGVIVAVLGALFRVPRRRDLVVLASGLVIGVLAQIVLGGLTVIFDLAPPFVMGHMVLSLILLANAVVLQQRARQPDAAAVPVVGGDVLGLARVMLAAAAVVVVTGTVVTGSGPHGGDAEAERLPFLPSDAARVHGIAVMAFLTLTVIAVLRVRRGGAPAVSARRTSSLLGAIVAQAAVGYTQYFTGVPALLVGIHVAGAAVVWAATVYFYLGLFHRQGAPETIEGWPEPLLSNSNAPASASTPTKTSAPTVPGS
jgi:cytochrome c oxidase assembly protein subunit 15